ncbi:hypothetical protein FNH05_00230 [Amycolatopsis rhizosphaerae]|uniref:Uncharacterized protein n=1 Tax=Amycolatopsis rhizosphaerae TaxID=2053003 RepID=A0A558DPJ4_9PSEU|nr:hypothetical protein [Amycolatopsis rhizosphaerae]TVT62969.1 hypothetical protein FNH05_00230 [Amycolatopsis rhizosphaerae]
MRTDHDEVEPKELAVSRRPLVLAGATGFVIGIAVVGLLWRVSGSGDGAIEDARAACGALTRAGPLPDGYANGTGQSAVDPGTVRHVVAARELSAAAAAESPVYESLADHLDGVSRMVISLNFGDPSGRFHLKAARDLCDHL